MYSSVLNVAHSVLQCTVGCSKCIIVYWRFLLVYSSVLEMPLVYFSVLEVAHSVLQCTVGCSKCILVYWICI